METGPTDCGDHPDPGPPTTWARSVWGRRIAVSAVVVFVVSLVFPATAGLPAWFAAFGAVAGPGGSPRT